MKNYVDELLLCWSDDRMAYNISTTGLDNKSPLHFKAPTPLESLATLRSDSSSALPVESESGLSNFLEPFATLGEDSFGFDEFSDVY
jgi:hypothetical protein